MKLSSIVPVHWRTPVKKGTRYKHAPEHWGGTSALAGEKIEAKDLPSPPAGGDGRSCS
jgi:hypothetical protein